MAKIYRICSIEGCGKRHEARGWCNLHYRRWRKYGDPLINPKTYALAWLTEAVNNRDRTAGCWEWPFSTFTGGYGQVRYYGPSKNASQIALILDGKPQPPPPGHFSLHSCDNRPCVNPAHLRWGTPLDNFNDMVSRDRGTGLPEGLLFGRGSQHPKAKLTEADVPLIRADPRRNSVVAREYGVSQTAIYHIKRRVTWRHVPEC